MTYSSRRALVSAKGSFTPPDSSQESPTEPDVPPRPQAKPLSETPNSLSIKFVNEYYSSPPPLQDSPLPLPSPSSGYPPSPPSGTAPITPFIAVPFSVFLAFLLLNAFILVCIRRKADAFESATANETGEEGSAAAETRSPTAAAAAAAAAASWFGSFSPRGSGQSRSQGWRPADNRGLDRALIDALPCHVFREVREADAGGGSLGKHETAPTLPSCEAAADPTVLAKAPAVLLNKNEGEACSEGNRETEGGEPPLAMGGLSTSPVFSEEVDKSQDPNRLVCRPAVSEPACSAAEALRECPVCLCEYEDGDVVKTIPKCSHGFHVECIDAWLQRKTTCPLCRVELRPEEKKLRPDEEEDVSHGADQQEMQRAAGQSHGSETSSDDSEEQDLLPSMQSPTQAPTEDNTTQPPPLQQ